MTVKQLIAKLKKLPQNAPVVYAIDEEGNAFHMVYNEPSEGIFCDGEGFVSEECIKEYPEDYAYLKNNGIKAVCIN